LQTVRSAASTSMQAAVLHVAVAEMGTANRYAFRRSKVWFGFDNKFCFPRIACFKRVVSCNNGFKNADGKSIDSNGLHKLELEKSCCIRT